MKRHWAIWAVAALAVLAPAVRADDAPVSISRTPKAGEVHRFKGTINANVAGNDAVLTQTVRETTKDVKPNGDVVVEHVIEGTHLTVAGMDQDMPAVPPVLLTSDKYGKLVKYNAPEGAAGVMTPEVQQLLAALSAPIYPEKPVATNGSWESDLDNPAVKGKKYTIKSTYLGTDKVDGKDLWKLKQTSTAETDADGNKLTYDATYWLDPATGQEVKSEAQIKNLPTNYGPMDMTIKTERVTGDDKAPKPEDNTAK